MEFLEPITIEYCLKHLNLENKVYLSDVTRLMGLCRPTPEAVSLQALLTNLAINRRLP